MPGYLQAVRHRQTPHGSGTVQPGEHQRSTDMKKTIATALASLAFIGAAYAATVDGVVQSVDPATRTVTLEDGKTYKAADDVSLEALAAGTKVTVTVDDTTGDATGIEAQQ